MKIQKVICPECNEGEFKTIKGKNRCVSCGGLLTDEIIEKELDRAWGEHQEEIKKDSINILRDEIHQNAKEHGWWDEERSFGDIIALCHSELSEALEEHRNGKLPNEIYYNGEKPEGIPVELADVIIRILDYCGKENIDIESTILEKHEYNKTRPYKHGGKKI